jgi:hypothetical protein
LRLTPQAVARPAQRPGLILATAEEWGIFCGALSVLGRSGLGWLLKGWGWGAKAKSYETEAGSFPKAYMSSHLALVHMLM